MKKLAVFITILLMPLIVNAESALKIGFMLTYGRVSGYEFTIPSTELKFEKSIYKSFCLGFGIRKETRWAYNGYYLMLYPTFRIPLSERVSWNIGAGAEYGIASTKYDSYRPIYDQNGSLVYHKRIYLIQNASIPGSEVKSEVKKDKTGVLYPFLTTSFGVKFWKGLSLEFGSKVQMLRFGVKSCEFDSGTHKAYNIREEKIWKIIPSAFIQMGISFGKKKQQETEV